LLYEENQLKNLGLTLVEQAKSEFLANMSHELRTPLNAILGFSEVMVSEVFGPLGNDRYRGYAQDIHSSGSHLLSIINDVLDLSKAAAGKLELVEGWIDAREIVKSVCRLIGPRIGEAKLSLTVQMPPTAWSHTRMSACSSRCCSISSPTPASSRRLTDTLNARYRLMPRE
jgi:signal transduction histidine kinase